MKASERFDGEAAAAKYAGALPGTSTDRRERRCLRRALHGVAAGASVLDLPCGAGRFLPFLAGLGYRATGADSSPHMMAQARRAAGGEVGLLVADVFRAPFRDGAFDAVVCNRLLHHLAESEDRRAALRDLRRVCRGPIVVSFFRDLGVDALVWKVKHRLRGRRPADRIPIPLRTLRADAEAAGLRIVRTFGARPLISKQWYALLTARRGNGWTLAKAVSSGLSV